MKNTTVVCIIPARYGSERLEGKVLYELKGRSILERVYNRARLIKSFSEIYIATDHKKIAAAAERFGAKTIMTSIRCSSGSDRVAEAAKKIDADIIVNIQADEPYIPVAAVEKPLKLLLEDESLCVTTAATKIRKREELYDPNIAKIVVDKDNFTLYSSRSLIPYPTPYFADKEPFSFKRVQFYKHIGVYLFRKKFLKTFAGMPVSYLEKIERLEQLRIIENGYKLKVAIIQQDSPCVDTLEDIKRIERR
jgi:3-deoxy-manno-octulosonate cytidylyltransferase (CMP-KDO synthetase)